MLLFMVWSLSAAVADVTLPHEYMGRDPDESPTRWENKRWLNVPGPFYTGWTDTCWAGRPLAPNNVLYSGDGDDDAGYEEFIFCQPRDAAELAAVVVAAKSEVYAGYACDGDQHWTPALVRGWWAERAAVSEWIDDRQHDQEYLEDSTGEQMLPEGLRAFAAYLEGPLEGDLRRYMFRLETGTDVTPADHLPAL